MQIKDVIQKQTGKQTTTTPQTSIEPQASYLLEDVSSGVGCSRIGPEVQ